jgi:hypothetical protein
MGTPLEGMILVVDDIEVAREDLISRGADPARSCAPNAARGRCRAETRGALVRQPCRHRRPPRQRMASPGSRRAPAGCLGLIDVSGLAELLRATESVTALSRQSRLGMSSQIGMRRTSMPVSAGLPRTRPPRWPSGTGPRSSTSRFVKSATDRGLRRRGHVPGAGRRAWLDGRRLGFRTRQGSGQLAA